MVQLKYNRKSDLNYLELLKLILFQILIGITERYLVFLYF